MSWEPKNVHYRRGKYPQRSVAAFLLSLIITDRREQRSAVCTHREQFYKWTGAWNCTTINFIESVKQVAYQNGPFLVAPAINCTYLRLVHVQTHSAQLDLRAWTNK